MFTLKKKKRGASLTGYGLVVGLIAVIAIAAVQNVGDNISTLFGKVSNDMDAVATGTTGGGGAPAPSAPAALSISVASGDKDNMDVTGAGAPAYGASVTFTVTNTGDEDTGTLNAMGLGTGSSTTGDGNNFEATGVGDDCAGSPLNGGQTCTIEIRPLASADGVYSGNLAVSAGALSDSILISGTASGVVAPEGYFVMSSGSYNGNLGGILGADSICQADLRDNDWMGKSSVADCTASSCSRAKAFICDGSTCNILAGDSVYNFAFSGTPATGGASFTTTAFGQGPSDNNVWNAANIFGVTTALWTNVIAASTSLWGTIPSSASSNFHCSNWTTTSSTGLEGLTNYTSGARWGGFLGSCSTGRRLICTLDPL